MKKRKDREKRIKNKNLASSKTVSSKIRQYKKKRKVLIFRAGFGFLIVSIPGLCILFLLFLG